MISDNAKKPDNPKNPKNPNKPNNNNNPKNPTNPNHPITPIILVTRIPLLETHNTIKNKQLRRQQRNRSDQTCSGAHLPAVQGRVPKGEPHAIAQPPAGQVRCMREEI